MNNISSVSSGHTRVSFFGLLIMALVLVGCVAPSDGGEATQGSQAPAATSAPMAATAPVPTTASATAIPVPTKAVTTTSASTPAAQAPLKPATVKVSKNDKLGQLLTDNNSKTLYLFTKDTKDRSNCYDNCATAWPPLLTAGAPVAGDGVTMSLLGTTVRKDGLTQVTYNGWPLYYYVKDQKAGDTTGQDVGGVWYVLSPKGAKLEAAKVMAAKNDKLGQILTDDEGKTLYTDYAYFWLPVESGCALGYARPDEG